MILAGVDISTWKLTICFLQGEPGTPTDLVTWETARLREAGASYVSACQAAPAALALALGRAEVRPSEAYVERGWGDQRRSDFPLGAIFGATVVALGKAAPGCHVEQMQVQTWKKAVTAEIGMVTKKGELGLGNAPKAVANEACQRILRTWAGLGSVKDPDQLDAFGVAFAGWMAER